MNNCILPHKMILGNTRTPLMVVLMQDGKPVDLAGKTAKFLMKTENGTAIVDNGTVGVTAHPTSTFTVVTGLEWLIANDHLVREGDQIVVSNSGGGLPTGLAASTRYFARDVRKNRFRLCEVEGEAAIDISTAGTGTHSYYVVGSVHYDFQAADVDEAGQLRAWFNIFDGSEYDTFPAEYADYIPVWIREAR